MEREVGGGIGMGNTCKPLAVSFQCMTKSTSNKKKKKFLPIISEETIEMLEEGCIPLGPWRQTGVHMEAVGNTEV